MYAMQQASTLSASVRLLPVLCAAVAALTLMEAPEQRFPVSRVVNLLKDMKAQLEKEADKDEEVYDKFACWCETNDKTKTTAISDAEAKLSQLQSTIETTLARTETFKAEIDAEAKELAQNQRALAEATALREKQSSEFTVEEKEMMESIQALNAAIMVLSKHHEGAAAAFIDSSRHAASRVSASSATLTGVAARQAATAAAVQLRRHAKMLRAALTPHQKHVIAALAEQPDYLDAAPTFKQSYAPQSGEIFGILRQMKETFETNLNEGQKQELADQESFKSLKVLKEEEIRVGQVTLEDKKQELSAAQEKLVQAKNEREDTQASLSADEAYLLDLKQRCSLTDQEWEERQKTRREEMQAVNEAIAILTTDDARELFSRTFNNATSFVQTRRNSRSWRRDQAAEVLQRAAARTGNPTLSALATKVHLDAFIQVKKAIDDMVAQLLKEADDEVQQQKYCVDEMAKNERSTAKEVHTKAKVQSSINTLKMTVDGLNKTIETLQAEIADLKAQREQAKVDRQLEHQEFQHAVADQRQTQVLLMQAIETLSKVYAKVAPAAAAAGAGLTELRTQYGPPPPKDFFDYEKQRRASPILALLEHILADVKAMEAEYVQDEDKALIAYQDFVQQTVRGVEAKDQSLVDRRSEKVQAEQDLREAKLELGETQSELEALSNTLAELKGGCDYLIKNFEVRSRARSEEVEALRQAKAFLSGMQPDAATATVIAGAAAA